MLSAAEADVRRHKTRWAIIHEIHAPPNLKTRAWPSVPIMPTLMMYVRVRASCCALGCVRVCRESKQYNQKQKRSNYVYTQSPHDATIKTNNTLEHTKKVESRCHKHLVSSNISACSLVWGRYERLYGSFSSGFLPFFVFSSLPSPPQCLPSLPVSVPPPIIQIQRLERRGEGKHKKIFLLLLSVYRRESTRS